MAKMVLLDLEQDDVVGSLDGLVTVIVGDNNTGKTFNATKFEKPLLLMSEYGGRGVKCHKIPCTSWAIFLDVVKQLTDPKTLPEMQSKFKTIIVDTLSNLVAYNELATSQSFGVTDLSEITGKQNGYKISRTNFAMAINKLVSVGYHVVFIDHTEVITQKDELTGEDIEFIIPKGSNNEKSSARLIRDMADVVAYVKANPYDTENMKEVPSSLIFKRTKHVFARSRFSDLPLMIPVFTAESFKETVLNAIESRAELEGSGISDFARSQERTKEEWFNEIKPLMVKVHGSYPDKAVEITETYLGQGRKITSATDDESKKLESIYNDLLGFVIQMGL